MKSFLSFTKWDLYLMLICMSGILTVDVMDTDGWEGFSRACILGALFGAAWAMGGFSQLAKLSERFERQPPSIH